MKNSFHNIPIHFGNLQGKHEIDSDSLLILIEAYKKISSIFNLSINVHVGMLEQGGWKTKLIVTISFIGISPISTLLTSKTADEWAKEGHIYITKFITTKADELPNELPQECIKQKNKIYQQFQKDACIDSFKIDDVPAIPKGNFHSYIKKIPDEDFIYLGETNIIVHSPDWKGKRSWKGKIEILKGQEHAFKFDKTFTGIFWKKIKSDSLQLHTKDTMRVQLIERPTNTIKYLVVRVLTYNNNRIDSILDDEYINEIATSNQILDNSIKEENLFSSSGVDI